MMNARTGFVLLLVLGLAPVLTGCSVNPATRELEFSTMSRSEEIQQGRRAYPIMTQLHDGELQGQQLQAYVTRIGNRIASESHRPDLPYRFNVVNSSSANAYALPGGFISITRGLLLELNDEDELAALLGHEIAHAAARHAAQQQGRNLLATVASLNFLDVRVLGLSVLGPYQTLSGLGAQAILASYSREQEREADRLGLLYMVKAGFDPAGMEQLHQTLLRVREDKPNFVEQFFSTHPLTEERIERARTMKDDVVENVTTPDTNPPRRFEPVVAEVWKPRRPAYRRMDTGLKHLQAHDTDAALESFQAAIDRYDQEALFYAWLGQTRHLEGRARPARRAFDRAKKLHSDVFRIRFFSGVNHFVLDGYRSSLEDLKAADELLPDVPTVTFLRARNHEELGNQDRAASMCRRFLERVDEGKRAAYCRQRLETWEN